jgi:hypothetical protein
MAIATAQVTINGNTYNKPPIQSNIKMFEHGPIKASPIKMLQIRQ